MAIKKLPRPAPTHIDLNATHNRSAAMQCFKAGIKAEAIAAHWPRVWRLADNGAGGQGLAQIYDTEYSDGRMETRVSMLGVAEFIKANKPRKRAVAKAKGTA